MRTFRLGHQVKAHGGWGLDFGASGSEFPPSPSLKSLKASPVSSHPSAWVVLPSCVASSRKATFSNSSARCVRRKRGRFATTAKEKLDEHPLHTRPAWGTLNPKPPNSSGLGPAWGNEKLHRTLL